MRNIKIIVEYDGTNYNGWQIQKGKRTIQAELVKAIEKITGERVKVIGASRTDANVHAKYQVANFKTKSRIPIDRFPHAINANLPPDIVVKSAEEVSLDFNSIKCAKSKAYRYTIFNSVHPPAIGRNYCYHIRTPLNIEEMRRAANYLIGTHDFRAFVTEASRKRNTIRTIKSITIFRDKEFIYLDITGDAFLYKMVRSIAGTLVKVGQGKMKAEDVKGILEKKDRKLAGPNLPAKGLCLMYVDCTQ